MAPQVLRRRVRVFGRRHLFLGLCCWATALAAPLGLAVREQIDAYIERHNQNPKPLPLDRRPQL